MKKLKIEYLHGEIGDREEYNRRKKELEDISSITDELMKKEQTKDYVQPETIIVSEKKNEVEPSTGKLSKDKSTKICPKCGIENKPESNFCRKCGTSLK